MRYSSVNRGIPGGNPIANALVVIVGVLAIAASLVLGFFAFVVLGSIVLVLGAIDRRSRPVVPDPVVAESGEYHARRIAGGVGRLRQRQVAAR